MMQKMRLPDLPIKINEDSKMERIFWDKRPRGYDDNTQRHNSQYKKTIGKTRSLLADSDIVLDFGCASGEISLDIASHVQRVHGIDLSGKMIELAIQKAAGRQVDNAIFDRMDAFDLRLAGHSFSAVAAFNIFHLIEDTRALLARLNDLLVPGGILISQTPCLGERGWLFRLLIGLAQKSGMAPAILNFTFPELETLISGGNFVIIESKLWDQKNAVQWITARKI